jgi:putative transferase (TIGR04331 family)
VKVNLIGSNLTRLWLQHLPHAHFLSTSALLCSGPEATIKYRTISVNKESYNLLESIEFIERGLSIYLPELAKRLRYLHGYSESFWRQVLFFYIRDLLGATRYFFDRLEQASQSKDCELRLLQLPSRPPLYSVFGSLVDAQYSHSTSFGREYFIGEYFRLFCPDRFEELSVDAAPSLGLNDSKENFSLRRVTGKLLKRLNDARLNPLKEIIITNAKYDAIFARKLTTQSLGKVHFTETTPSLLSIFNENVSRNSEMRSTLSMPFSGGVGQNKFEQYFCHCLHNSFPWSLTEGFQQSLNFYEEYWNKFPNLKFLVTENQYQHDSLALATYSRMRDKKIIALPHFFPWEILHNFKLNDAQTNNFFEIARGSDISRINTVGSGSVYSYSVDANDLTEKTYDILYIASEYTPYLLDYQLSVDGDGDEIYQRFKSFTEIFFSHLPNELIQKIWLKERAEPRFEGMKITHLECLQRLNPEGLATSYMSQSKIIIVEGFSTALFEALVTNVPVLTFWPDGLYHFDTNHISFFKELVDAEVVHHNPVLLAQKLIDVRNDPDCWWHSEEVQLARTNFLKRNLHLLPEMEKTIMALLSTKLL